ncbi:MAG: glycosyltransferase family 9 protein [Candidatus Abyssubacteria bacterium]|nr:glycosyltransferase family 9 protein [Candidatus Abyssubacteria bacterium]
MIRGTVYPACYFLDAFWKMYCRLFQRSKAIGRPPRKLLLVHFSGIGNFVMFTPVINELKDRYPDADISLLLPANGCADVIKGHEHIKEIIVFDFFRHKWRKEFLGLLMQVRGKKYDTVIVSPMRFAGALIAFFSGAGNRVGHRYQFGPLKNSSFLYTHPVDLDDIREHEVEQNLNLLKPFNITASAVPRMIVHSDNGSGNVDFALSADKKRIGIHAGCGADQTERRWPKECFIELAKKLEKTFDMDLVFFAGPCERELVSEIVDSVNGNSLLVTDKPLKEVIRIIDRCHYFVTTDSGLGHIANALGIPTLAIFGPANSNRTGPYGAGNVVVRKKLPCSPCYMSRGQEIECDDIRCLRDLGVGEVLEGFRKLMAINANR